MTAAVKKRLTVGVSAALLGAGVLAVSPAPTVDERVSSRPYTLTAATVGLGNVPGNLLNLVLSVPAWETQAMNRFADAMLATGSWQVWGPTNVVGFDEEDPPKLKALIDMLVPVKPLSTALGERFGWWAAANLPMNPGCAAQPGACPHQGAFMSIAMKVPMSTLYQGYQFPEVTNPFTGEPTSWSGQYVKLERGAPATALRAYLTAPPTGPETVSPGEFAAAVGAVGKSVRQAFYPFVQDSEWFNGSHLGTARLFRKLAPQLCPTCDPDKPYDNPWLYDNYPPNNPDRVAAAKRAVQSSAARQARRAVSAPGAGSGKPQPAADRRPASQRG